MLNKPLKIWHALLLAGALVALALAVTGAQGQSSARTYVDAKTFDVPANSVGGTRILCQGRGNLSLGGGVDVANASVQSVRSTRPVDDDDDNGRPEDGWSAQVKNDSGQALSATVFVTCG